MPSPASLTVIVFVLTYVGMAVGRIPGLKVDRAGIALMAIAILLAGGAIQLSTATTAIDGATLVLMFGLMILSAQFGEAGVYETCAARIVRARAQPHVLLAVTILIAGGLSAVLVNDIVVFAMAPILCVGLNNRGMDPRPFLVALAAAGNAGSAATLIGNPQNILIGQVGDLNFWRFLMVCAPPALASLLCVYVFVKMLWAKELHPANVSAPQTASLNRRQAAKAALATVALILLFAAPIPREVAALAVAAALLASRTIASRRLVAAVDWQLLLLIACLFIVTGAFAATGVAESVLRFASDSGLAPDSLLALAPGALIVSNTIGNVPATILILALWPTLPEGTLYGLSLLMTLAGNLFIVGSLCNLIVAERAAAHGVTLTFGDFARAGVPMTLVSMIIAVLWLWAGGWMAF